MNDAPHTPAEQQLCAESDEARSCYTGGRNCAESVLSACADYSGDLVSSAAGAGFTSGIGNSGCICGAVAAGVMVISSALEAEGLEPAAKRLAAEELSAEYYRRFKEQYRSTCCRVLKRGMVEGSNEVMAHCAGITEFATALAVEMLQERGGKKRWATRDHINAVRRSASNLLAGAAVGLLLACVAAADQAGAVVAAGAVLGLALGVIVEWGAARRRVVGRALRAAGVVSAGILLVAAALAPGLLAARLAVLASPTLFAIVARAAVAVAALVAAAMAAYDYRRFK